jgi:hypothetical protein
MLHLRSQSSFAAVQHDRGAAFWQFSALTIQTALTLLSKV